MRTVGIIVEYNPLHNGHVYHYQQSRNVSGADAVIAVMSGHFLQRGEPALVNKWARTEMALRMGVDLVIELPVAYAAQPAEWFAYGAVSALHACGVVDTLCFGSESGEIGWLAELADLLADEPMAFRQLLQDLLKQGLNYPAAYTAAVQQYLAHGSTHGDRYAGPIAAGALAKPNNTLGLHYLLALRRLNSHIQPLTIPRTAAGYHDPLATDSSIASATAIRQMLSSTDVPGPDAAKPYVPPSTMTILQQEWTAGRAPVSWERLAIPLYHALLSRSPEELATIAEVSEGLENRLLGALPNMQGTWSVDQLIERCKTKRYTRTKLQRALTRILLGHSKSVLHRDILVGGVPYLRVLGFSQQGRQLLKRMRQTATVPIITNIGRSSHPMLALDIRATGVYASAYQSLGSREVLRDYYEPPIFLQD